MKKIWHVRHILREGTKENGMKKWGANGLVNHRRKAAVETPKNNAAQEAAPMGNWSQEEKGKFQILAKRHNRFAAKTPH